MRLAIDRSLRVELDIREGSVVLQLVDQFGTPRQGAHVQSVVEEGPRLQGKGAREEPESHQLAARSEPRVALGIAGVRPEQVGERSSAREDLGGLEGPTRPDTPRRPDEP